VAAQYYNHPQPVITGASAHVEIFESSFEFTNPYVDSDSQRAVYNIPITVRVTWFNRDGDTRETMVTRGRRYSAGVFNVFNKNPTLADSDDATQLGVVERVTPAWEGIDEPEPGTFKGSIVLECEVKCEENQ
jgi:hypothetical protein